MGVAKWALNAPLLLLVIGAGAALANSGTRSPEFCLQGWPDNPRNEPCEGKGTPGEMLSVTEDLTLNGDHRGAITIGSDGVTLDCAGHSVIGYGPAGIDIIDRIGVTVENCSVWGFDVGIRLQGTTDASITGNTASANQIGFSLLRSSGNLVENNEAHLNRTGFSLRRSDTNRLLDNLTIRGLVGFDLSGAGNELRGNEARDTDRGIAVAGSGNVVVDNVLTRASIELPGSANTVSHNEVSGAIRVEGSKNALMGNHVQVGGFVITGSENTFTENTATDVPTAFRLNGATGNVFTENLVKDASVGFGIAHSRDNSFVRNTVSAERRGLGGRAVTPHNTFIDNTGLGLGATLTVTEDLTLRADFTGRIIIGAGGITLDCAGHRIIPTSEDARYAAGGIDVHGFDDVTVKNCSASDYKVGVALIDTAGGALTGNRAAIRLRDSAATTISDNIGESISLERQSHRNTIADNTVESIGLKGSNRNTIDNNTVESMRLKKSNRNTITGSALTAGALRLIESDHNSVADNSINSSDRGIEVMAGSQNAIVGNTLSDTRIGIAVRKESASNVVETNTVTGSEVAIGITNSSTTTLTSNTIADTRLGFWIRNSHDNLIRANELENTEVGLEANDKNKRTYGNTLHDNIGM